MAYAKRMHLKFFEPIADDSNLKLIRDYLSNGFDANLLRLLAFGSKRCESALQTATKSKGNNPEVVKELIQYGADLNFQDDYGYTPLHYAVLSKKLDVVNVLVESGTVISINSPRDSIALHKAIDSQEGDLLDAKITRKLLQQQGINLDAQNLNGNTPLMFAVKNDFLEAVDILLLKGANPNIVNDDMESPLHLAFATSDPNYKIVAALLMKGADIYIEDKKGQSPMDLLIHSVRDNQSLCFTKKCLKAIVLRYEINEDLTLKIEAVPQLQPFLGQCCEENEKMKGSFIAENVTIHDFILDNFQKNNFRDPLMDFYKPVVEWLIQGFCVEYFSDIFDRISSDNLVLLLEIAIDQIKDDYRKEGTFNNMLSKIIISDLAKFLSRSDTFYLIVAVSNVKISESLETLYERRITYFVK